MSSNNKEIPVYIKRILGSNLTYDEAIKKSWDLPIIKLLVIMKTDKKPFYRSLKKSVLGSAVNEYEFKKGISSMITHILIGCQSEVSMYSTFDIDTIITDLYNSVINNEYNIMKYKFMIESVELYCKEFNENEGGSLDEK